MVRVGFFHSVHLIWLTSVAPVSANYRVHTLNHFYCSHKERILLACFLMYLHLLCFIVLLNPSTAWECSHTLVCRARREGVFDAWHGKEQEEEEGRQSDL